MKDLNRLYVRWNILGLTVRCRHIVTQEVEVCTRFVGTAIPSSLPCPVAHAWLTMQADLGRAPATIAAYGAAAPRLPGLHVARTAWSRSPANRAHIATYVRDLEQRAQPAQPP